MPLGRATFGVGALLSTKQSLREPLESRFPWTPWTPLGSSGEHPASQLGTEDEGRGSGRGGDLLSCPSGQSPSTTRLRLDTQRWPCHAAPDLRGPVPSLPRRQCPAAQSVPSLLAPVNR